MRRGEERSHPSESFAEKNRFLGENDAICACDVCMLVRRPVLLHYQDLLRTVLFPSFGSA